MIVWIFLKVDRRHCLAAQWTVLILPEPLLDALLMEKVLIRIARHAYDLGPYDKRLTADKAFLHRFAKIGMIVGFSIARQIHGHTVIVLARSVIALATRTDRLKSTDYMVMH